MLDMDELDLDELSEEDRQYLIIKGAIANAVDQFKNYFEKAYEPENMEWKKVFITLEKVDGGLDVEINEEKYDDFKENEE